MSVRKIFLDGQWLTATKSLEEKLLPWKLSGQGVFETMRSDSGKILALDEHISRMQRGLKVLKIVPRFSAAAIKIQLKKILKINRLPRARIRLTVWKVQGEVHCAIVAQKYVPPSARIYRQGFKVRVASVRCRPGKRFSEVKSIRYELYWKAYQQALKAGCQEAILLNTKGEVAEASRSNIFIVKDGIFYTPSLESGCLNGITRQTVIKLARNTGIRVKEAKLKVNDLRRADEMFLTNSLMGIMSVKFCRKR